VEGVLFSSSFAFVYWLKTKAKMPGFSFSNELIARDEGMHRDLGVLLFTKYLENHRPKPEKVHEIVSEGVKLEQSFVKTSMNTGLLGLSTNEMCQYVEFIADHLLASMNVEKLYKQSNPLQFMELISLQGKTNFFEKRVGEYQKTNVGNTDADRFKLLDFAKEDFDL
jgi:ribonucleoside-diphosphate reductase beta chain